MDFKPAVSGEIQYQVDEIGHADVLVAIPAYNNEETISGVMKVAAEGLATFFADKKTVLFVCEGGSLDETKNVALMTDIGLTVDKIVGTYRGQPGKGNALRAVFQSALELGVEGCALMDADMRSVHPDWVNNLLDPVIREDYDFVAPYYRRDKFDGTITNTIVYPMITALYGKKLRQPIGGDFGLSAEFISLLSRQDVWDTFVGQFGIDAWMTISAVTGGLKICQANLGAKIHDAKDPAFSLGLMYLHVLSTLFRSMKKYSDFWMEVEGFDEVAVRGTSVPWEPEPIPISVTRLVEEFKMGMTHFSPLYGEVLGRENFERLDGISRSDMCSPKGYCDFNVPDDLWARVIYDLAVVFNCWKGNTHKLIDLTSPLYFGMVASLANGTVGMDYGEAEEVINGGMSAFVEQKPYFIRRWKEMDAGKDCSV